MFTPGIVIYEKKPRWEAVLKRALTGEPIQFRVCRLPNQVPKNLQQMPGSILVLDLAAGAADCLRLISKAVEMSPPAVVIVIGAAGQGELEWPARELGAFEFLPATIPDHELAAICRRLHNFSGSAANPLKISNN